MHLSGFGNLVDLDNNLLAFLLGRLDIELREPDKAHCHQRTDDTRGSQHASEVSCVKVDFPDLVPCRHPDAYRFLVYELLELFAIGASAL